MLIAGDIIIDIIDKDIIKINTSEFIDATSGMHGHLISVLETKLR